MKRVKLVGYEEFTSKKGNHCVRIHVMSTLNRRDSHLECLGENASNYFVKEHLKSKISASDVGKEITICTDIFGNSENLVDIVQ